MGKTKKTPVKENTNEKEKTSTRSNKIITKDGKVKKKILKQFTPYQCSVCHKKFSDKYNMSTHEKIHLDEEYPCTECGYVGRTKKYLARHKRSAHGTPRHACGVCGRAFHHPSGLKEHAMVHTGEKPLKCEVCGKGFRVRYSLNTHMLIHNNEKPFQCAFCEYSCRDSSTLRKHERRHMGVVTKFSCKICRKTFETRPKLKYHISEVHLDYLQLDLKRFPCDRCGKTFKLKANMLKHVEVMHGTTGACTCPLCGRRVKHKLYLARHLRTHFPERPHACTHAGCKKTFKEKGDLKKHAMIHAVHRHAACAQCGATFARAHRLTAHMRTHEPRDKAVVCDYCGVTFYTKNYLIKHIKQKHHNKQRYTCDHCGLVTSNKPSIVMHLKYSRCQGDELYCNICHTRYKQLAYLRSHYLKTHKMRYKAIRRRIKKVKKPCIEIKVEPVEDPYEDVQVTLLEVKKDEVDVEEEGALENDLISYSKRVLSEDLQECLLSEPSADQPGDSFDQFLLNHVFHKQVKEEAPVPKVEETDELLEASVVRKIKAVMKKAKEDETKNLLEKKKKKQEKTLEKKLKKEAKIMRSKRRRERFELERVRQMYNERMKRAAAEALKKEPAKKIKYFRQKTSQEVNSEKETDEPGDNNHKDNKGTSDNNEDSLDKNISKHSLENNNSFNKKNTEDNPDCTNELMGLSNDYDDKTVDTDNEKAITIIKRVGEPINDTDCKSVNDKDITTNDEGNGTNDGYNCANDENKCTDDQSSTNDVDNGNNDADNSGKDRNNQTNVINYNDSSILNVEDDNDDDSVDVKSDSDSNYEPDSENEAAPNTKMKFETHQCYVCFKLFPRREQLLAHCQSHFDICSGSTLSKCPACGHVANHNMARHMRLRHNLRVTIPHSKMCTRDGAEGSKYCYKMGDSVMEIIPSVQMLNHSAAVEIDRRRRETRDRALATTRLVKNGAEWVVEKCAVDVKYEEMAEFTDEELGKVPPSDSYVGRLGALGRLARARGQRVLYPCNLCDKICQNLCALKLHCRRHDPNKKPFAPRQDRRNAKTAPEIPKVKDIENRSAKPQPIRNKHKCDGRLIKFYQNHIRGADIQFWQFLKIYNKMDRENVNEFTDLENRTDFGMHTIYGDKPSDASNAHRDTETITKRGQASQLFRRIKQRKGQGSMDNLKPKENVAKTQEVTSKSIQHCDRKLGETSSKVGHNSRVNKVGEISKWRRSAAVNKPYKRVIMISKKQHLERERAKMLMREKIKGNI